MQPSNRSELKMAQVSIGISVCCSWLKHKILTRAGGVCVGVKVCVCAIPAFSEREEKSSLG